MGFKRVAAYMIDCTPEKAKEFLGFNNWEDQRAIDNGWLRELRDKREHGQFRPGNVAIARMNGSAVLANGQHCCTVIADGDSAHPLFVEEYACETKEDIAELFAQFDNTRSSRSQADINRPYASAFGMGHYGKACINFCVSSLNTKYRPASRGMTKEQRASILGMYPKQVEFLYNLLFSQKKVIKHLSSRAIIGAAILETWEKSPGDAKEFWSQVRDGQLLMEGDPAYLLRETLLDLTRRSVSESGKKVSDKEIRDKSINAWNAFRRKDKLKLLKFYKDSDGPDPI